MQFFNKTLTKKELPVTRKSSVVLIGWSFYISYRWSKSFPWDFSSTNCLWAIQSSNCV